LGLLKDLSRLSERREYGIPSRTLRGEVVRSYAEKQIADYFASNGVRYVYEQGARTNALIFKKTFARPDFFLPDYNLYVEYWGLLGTSKEYDRRMRRKMAQYHRYKIRFISLYPKNLENLDWVFKAKLKEATGYLLPSALARVSESANFCTICGAPIRPPGRFCIGCGRKL
jgi:hypothetical protein